jgi:formylglycine-generating enzyme required for sulfatase activity/dienelactone hydrolase
MSLPLGTKLGRYEILDLLGSGGMGVVYRARDDRLERDVAIKVLPPDAVSDDAARRRFHKEALALAKLSHPNIAAVYDVGEEAQSTFLVMERVSGESLAERLSRGPLLLVDALTFAEQIAAGLVEAHEQDVVHRDLKPANVMITPRGQAKILDFGLAKLLPSKDARSAAFVETASIVGGTPLYMSPEQAFGEPVDARTDIWSLGVVLYESLTGQTPFHGKTIGALLTSASTDPAPSVRLLRPDVPASVDAIIARALSKQAPARYQSAEEMREDIGAALRTVSGTGLVHEAGEVRLRWWIPVLGTALVAGLIGIAVALGIRQSHRTWARADAPAEIARLAGADLPLAAFRVLGRARGYVPGDTVLEALARSTTRQIRVTSTPAGAHVAIQDYLAPDSAWYELGVTPIAAATVPAGYFRWRVTPATGAPTIVAPSTDAAMTFRLDSAATSPAGMVRVEARTYEDYVTFIGWVGPYAMPGFDIDRYEVTNRDYQQFVDSGGYRVRQYWREPFVDGGRTVTWDSAMARFRDRTGRPGPSTWASGHYPDGQGDYPVGGISWYEASAYAAFRNRTLPTLVQWHEAAPPGGTRFVGAVSNTSHDRVAPVGSFKGVGPYGTYDMAGNVREWVYNATESGDRFILGGAWSSPDYLYAAPEALPPFDRSATNGARNVYNRAALPPATTAVVHRLQRDFSKVTPASDAVFEAYRVMYGYSAAPLDARTDGVIRQTADWRVERVSYNAAYGDERITAYLYLPARVKAPYQTVLFFPSARVNNLENSSTLGDTAFFDYVVQSGRAVLYPVYQDTYERRVRHRTPGATGNLKNLVDRARDVGRSLDYLETRPDVDRSRLAYLGVSVGGAEGAIYTTLNQERLRAVVFLDAGYFLQKPDAGGDQADFVPRLKAPVLMVNGRYDQTFSYSDAQLPMFRMLGTPAADKKHVVLPTAHDVTAQRSSVTREVLAWLDRYLGRVQ